MQYILGVDVWEGNPVIDEPILKAAGVEFMIVRINDMQGGHHLDANFYQQWEQAAPFVRWPYFVYNPWESGTANYSWLQAHMPADAHAVSVDLEVKKEGYPPVDYGYQVSQFLLFAKAHWNIDIYSGAGYKDILTPWPTDLPYWWARYLYIVYPPARESWTWEKLKGIMDSIVWNPGTTPGPCHNWQMTGDRLILPGCGGTCVDVNAWKGTLNELRAFAGCSTPLSWELEIDAWARTKGYTGIHP